MKNYRQKIELAKTKRHEYAKLYLTNNLSHTYNEKDTLMKIKTTKLENNDAIITVSFQHKKPKPLNEAKLNVLGLSMIRAIEFMDKQGYMLTDIKSESNANKQKKKNRNTIKLLFVFEFYGGMNACRICKLTGLERGTCSSNECDAGKYNYRYCSKCYELHQLEVHPVPTLRPW